MTERSTPAPFSLDDDKLFRAADGSSCAVWYLDGKLYLCTGDENLSLDPGEVGPFVAHIVEAFRHMLAADQDGYARCEADTVTEVELVIGDGVAYRWEQGGPFQGVESTPAEAVAACWGHLKSHPAMALLREAVGFVESEILSCQKENTPLANSIEAKGREWLRRAAPLLDGEAPKR